MRMWTPTSLSSYLMIRSSVCPACKVSTSGVLLPAGGAIWAESVSRCTCVCTSTLSAIWVSSPPETLASEM
eukprot:scaffold2938_cov125-Isochrysis_galbana.AAC.2